MPGILDLFGNPANQGILSTAAGLLNASGPSRMPVSFGQALGQGFQQGMQGYSQGLQLQQAQQEMEQRKALLALQQAEAARKANMPIVAPPGAQLFAPGSQSPFASVPFRPAEPQPVKAPTTRKLRIGNEEVTQEFDPQTMQWKEVGRGPAFNDKPLVQIDNRAESKYADVVAGKAGERDSKQFDAATAAPENIAKLDNVIQHLQSSDVITGPLADWKLKIEQGRQLFTNDIKAGKAVSDTQILDAALGSDVFPMIQSLGIGARGMDTPAEREFLRKVMTGTIELNKDTLIQMAKVRRDIAARAIERWNKRVDSGELDNYFKYSGLPKQKIEIPKPPSASPAQSQNFIVNKIYTDAQGNKARYLGNGKFQELP